MVQPTGAASEADASPPAPATSIVPTMKGATTFESLSPTAAVERAEQLRRWEESETNRQSDSLATNVRRRVTFPDNYVFAAACSAGEVDEVKKLLACGANIDTCNIDGLTVLHQAVIDQNLEMVKFLVENGADINAEDNEGWTPLMAAVSCNFMDVCRYLLDHGADTSMVNSEGELPIDLAVDEPLREMLQVEMHKRGVSPEVARQREESMMLRDAIEFLKHPGLKQNVRHPRTLATPLHVAAAKGYIKVMNILLQAGADVNAADVDGWTPLHAAAHWGEKQACEVLAENNCDMDAKTIAGQTCFDVADADMGAFLKQLKARQSQISSVEMRHPVEPGKGESGGVPRRRNAVVRLSTELKHWVSRADEQTEAKVLKIVGSASAESVSAAIGPSSDDGVANCESAKAAVNNTVEPLRRAPSPEQVASPATPSAAATLFPTPVASVGVEMENVEEKKLERKRTSHVEQTKNPEPLKMLRVNERMMPIPTSVVLSSHIADVAHVANATATADAVKVVRVQKTESLKDHRSCSSSTGAPLKTRSLGISSPVRALANRFQNIVSNASSSSAGNSSGNEVGRKSPTSKSLRTPKKLDLQSMPFRPMTVDDSVSREKSARMVSPPFHSSWSNAEAFWIKATQAGGGSRNSSGVDDGAVSGESRSGKNTTVVSIVLSPPPVLQPTMAFNFPSVSACSDTVHQLSRSQSQAPVQPPAQAEPRRRPVAADAAGSGPGRRHSPPVLPPRTTPAVQAVRDRMFSPPNRSDESEAERKMRAKKERESRRSTQGLDLGTIKQAELLNLAKDTGNAEAKARPESLDVIGSLVFKAKNIDSHSEVCHTLVKASATFKAPPLRRMSKNIDEEVTRPSSDELPTRTSSRVLFNSASGTNMRSALSTSSAVAGGGDSAPASSDEWKPETLFVPAIRKRLRGTRRLTGPETKDVLVALEHADQRRSSANVPRSPPHSNHAESSKSLSFLESRLAKPEDGSKNGLEFMYSQPRSSYQNASARFKKQQETTSLSPMAATAQATPTATRSLATTPTSPVASSASEVTASVSPDYRKLFEKERMENDRLSNELKSLEKLIEKVCDTFTNSCSTNNPCDKSFSSDRTDVNTTLEEVQKQLKMVALLKAENQRLKEENGALIRVISKLSK